MRTLLRTLLWIAGTAAISDAGAGNLVTNPDFDDGLNGWSSTDPAGTMLLDPDDGFPTSPSLRLTTNTAMSSCIQIDDSANVDLHVWVKRAGAAGGDVESALVAYSDLSCGALVSVLPYAPSALSDAPWLRLDTNDVSLPAGTKSVQVALGAVTNRFGGTADALFDHVAFGPTGTLDDAIRLAQEGLTGAWYNPETSGQGFEFVIDPGANGSLGSLFGAWYTYGANPGGPDTQRWYSLQSTFMPGDTVAGVTIYQNTGGNFNAPPATVAEPVGFGELTFLSCSHAMVVYQIGSDAPGVVPLRRLLPNVECDESGSGPSTSEFGLSGTWYDPATSGQGLLAEVNPANMQLFAGWYTYSPDHLGDGDPGDQRWFSLQGPFDAGASSMDVTIYASTGGTFDSGATTVTTQAVGLATLTFLTCTAATLDYAFTDGELAGQVGSIDLVRLGAPLASCPLDP